VTLPPGPRAPPFLQLAEYWLRPLALLERCRRRHGDIFTLRLGALGTTVVLAAPAAVRAVYTAPPDVLLGGAANDLLAPLMGESSIILLDGPAYNRQRKLLAPALSAERMPAHTTAMRDATNTAIDHWRAGDTLALLDEALRVTLEVILRTVFGVAGNPALGRALERVVDASSRLAVLFFPADRGPLSPGGWFRARVREADALIFAEIARRRAAPRGADVLSLLLDAVDDDGRPMSDAEIRDELITLLAGGYETTAATIAWTLALLLATPAALARARAEVEEVVGGAAVEAEHVPRLVFLDAAIREALRLRPIFNLSIRSAAAPFTVDGWTLPPGTVVAPCMYLVQRRPDLWPEPERFVPERFLDKRVDPLSWFPFGGGHRRCIGMALALHETKVFLAALLARVELAPVGPPVRPVRRNIILAPSGGARVRVRAAPRPRPGRR
jgi:cytochrome P450 family 110